MMEEHLRKRREREANATATGLILTLAVHLCALLFVGFTGLKYIYPPPAETSFVLDFQEEDKTEIKEYRGREPRSEAVDKEQPVNVVQRSESPYTAQKNNVTPETANDEYGDVETPAPEQEEPVLDARASFPGMARKDTSVTAPHSAVESSDKFKAGQAQGNTLTGVTEGRPNAHLEGRAAKGNTITKPVYKIQQSGRVVVKIWVDVYGNVTKAMAGAEGTTIADNKLWNECVKQAFKAKFAMSTDAPSAQEGTITYIFNLK